MYCNTYANCCPDDVSYLLIQWYNRVYKCVCSATNEVLHSLYRKSSKQVSVEPPNSIQYGISHAFHIYEF